MPYKNRQKQLKYSKNYSKKHYEANKEKAKRLVADRRRGLQEYLREYKEMHKCSRCREANPDCLDFHHLRNKKYNMPLLATRGVSLKKLIKEIEKCIVLCANCHRKEHAKKRRPLRKRDTERAKKVLLRLKERIK